MPEVLKLTARRFWISRETGLPVTKEVGNKKELWHNPTSKHPGFLKCPSVITYLKGRINFYIVFDAPTGKVVVMSDGIRTLYVWLGNLTSTYHFAKRSSPFPSGTEAEARQNFFKPFSDGKEPRPLIAISELKNFSSMPTSYSVVDN